MHLALTDVLTCPRCGPAFGLILLAHDVRERRVHTGVLGCANCREKYVITGGGGAFGAEPLLPRTARDVAGDVAASERLAALLGVTHGPGFLLLVGPAARHAPALSDMVPDVEMIAISYGAPDSEAAPETAGVSRLGLRGTVLPLASGKLLGVALSGAAADTLLEEGMRVLSPVGRLVLEAPPAAAENRLNAAGLRVLARDETALVAARR